MRALELYCGMGGFAAALASFDSSVVSAFDIDRRALEVYANNFPHPVVAAEIASVSLASFEADFWWLSPPCRPFTQRGRGKDIHDPRTESFLKVIRQIEQCRPFALGVENVPPFGQSVAAERLRRTLVASGYQWQEWLLCPTQLGFPMRRRRYYLLASQGELLPLGSLAIRKIALPRFLDGEGAAKRLIPQDWRNRYRAAIRVLDTEDVQSVASCFTAAYGRSPVRSGSYLRQSGKIRFFSPCEIARLMGFSDQYRLPKCSRTAYRLLGNSLAVPVVKRLLQSVFGGDCTPADRPP